MSDLNSIQSQIFLHKNFREKSFNVRESILALCLIMFLMATDVDTTVTDYTVWKRKKYI